MGPRLGFVPTPACCTFCFHQPDVKQCGKERLGSKRKAFDLMSTFFFVKAQSSCVEAERPSC